MKNLNLLLTKCLVTGLAVAGMTAASAAPLSGAISSVGTLCLGSRATAPIPALCTHQDASTLTYLDFINGGADPIVTPTPGESGDLLFLTATGDLATLTNRVGQINDFMLPGPTDPMSSFSDVDPLWYAVGADGAMYTYALEDLISVYRINGHAIDVRGTGTLCRNDADCNLFSFLFTTQDADGAIRTTFSLSQSGFGKVPEPGSLTLLGLGLAGFAAGVRRRRAR